MEPMDQEEARTAVALAIVRGLGDPAKQVPHREIDDLATDILPLWEQAQQTAPTPGRLSGFLPLRYVIPSHDLKIVETCCAVLSAAAGANFLIPQLASDPIKSLAPAIVGVVVAVLKLLHNLRLSVRLTPVDHAVVALLVAKKADGLTTVQVFDALRPTWPDVSEQLLEARLTALTACATVSGTKTALVWKDPDGCWHTNGV